MSSDKEKGLDQKLPVGFIGWWDCVEEDFFYEEIDQESTPKVIE